MRSLVRYGPCFATVLVACLGTACRARQTEEPLLVPAPDSPIAVPGSPGSLALGDVNQDGKPDLVVASDRGMTVLLGHGDGRFRVGPGSPIAVTPRATEMVLGELNGDGILDLALASHDSYTVMLLFGDGNGGFSLAAHSPIIMKNGQHPHTHGLHAGDLSGDGALDLVSVNSEDNDLSVAFGDGKGGFTPADSTFAVGPSPYPGALGDLNGDGHLDIIATSAGGRTPARALTILLGDGRGSFRGSPAALRTGSPGCVAVGDVNGDAKLDLVATHLEQRELSVLIGDGEGAFAEANGSPFDFGGATWHTAITDVNSDGNADVVAGAGDGVRVMLGDGRGSFEPASNSPFATGKGSWQLVVGDMNGDDRPDVVTSNLESNDLTVLLAR